MVDIKLSDTEKAIKSATIYKRKLEKDLKKNDISNIYKTFCLKKIKECTDILATTSTKTSNQTEEFLSILKKSDSNSITTSQANPTDLDMA